MEFIDLDLVFSVISAIAAGIVYGFAGFGAAYVLIPLFSLIYGAREAVAVVMIMVTLGSVGLVFNTARHVAWRQIGPMSVLAMLTIPVGSLILLTVDPELMRRAIGAVILVLAAALLMGIAYRGPRNLITAAVAGIVGGLTHGAVGLGGLAVSLYVLSSEDSATVQRAGVIVFSALVAAVSTIVLTISGVVDSTHDRAGTHADDPVRDYTMVRGACIQIHPRTCLQAHRVGLNLGARRHHSYRLRAFHLPGPRLVFRSDQSVSRLRGGGRVRSRRHLGIRGVRLWFDPDMATIRHPTL